ncbi:AAA family ATPase [Pseudomonas sp. FEN]|uniref:AAA family ATPase n=1 Tax=Pseudomonas sp. FEN TaxID=2767468 RepID=UPI001CD1C740|nr:AAA family ATPase [Pseudomonas sp. FEN]
MATKPVKKPVDKAEPKAEVAPRARLHKLVISNFRAIGKKPVTIELDDIVVLVGPNNAGKSSVLRAYEVVMQSGKLGELTIEDFPNAKIPDPEDVLSYPTIELETVLYENSKFPAQQWMDVKENGDRHVRERWIGKTLENLKSVDSTRLKMLGTKITARGVPQQLLKLIDQKLIE